MPISVLLVRSSLASNAVRCVIVACFGLLAGSCSTLGYYAHVVQGESTLLSQRKPVSDLLADPSLDATLRARLESAEAARAFASDHLDLPRNRSYTSYVALNRPYVTWSVLAAPEFSIQPVPHCFPFAGCVAYLGFFDHGRAVRAAAKLAAQGDDTQVQGVAAYSTLGWFADPILSSMMRWSDDELDGVIFHELAHQKIYVKSDTAFNESFATFVQEEGLREWRSARGQPVRDDAARARDDAFTRLVLDLRERLGALYAKHLATTVMRAAKQEEIAAFRARYAELRAGILKNDSRWDAWVARPINNASLVSFGLYDRWVPAFEHLFQQAGRQWPAFFASVKALAAQSPHEREKRLLEMSQVIDRNVGLPGLAFRLLRASSTLTAYASRRLSWSHA